MKHIPHVFPPWIINLFFALGLVSAFAFRSIIVFEHVNPVLVRPIWYFAVVGYIFFFIYRYSISRKRRAVIIEYNLIEKIEKREDLTDEEREAAIYSLSSLVKSREIFNYLFISILSVLAIAADIVLSLYGK
jgi:uncharacterized membrane protein